MSSILENISSLTGQSAIEYLMTYGWMLLVVAITGGAIFSITGNQSIESTNGFSGGDVSVENFGLSSNSLDFILRNTASEEVKINSIKITDPQTGVKTTIQPKTIIQVSETDKIRIPGVTESDGSQTPDMEINYNMEGLQNLTTTGSITGTLNAYNTLTLQNARFNRTNDQLHIDTKNIGSKTTDSINYTIQANNTEYKGSLNNLNPSQKTTINITTGQTYPIESVKLDANGPQFVDSNSNIKCTPTQELVGYWPLNEDINGDEGTVLDLSRKENHGSTNGEVNTGKEGKVSRAMEFDGVNDYIEIPDSQALSGGSDAIITAGAWFKVPDASSNNKLIEKQWNGGYGDWGLAVLNNKIDYYSENGGNDYHLSGGNVQSDKWHHGMFVLDQQNNNSKLYLDGEKIAEDDSTGLISSDTEGNIYLGARFYRNSDNKGYFTGKIDEPKVYSRALSQQEIQRLYEIRDEDWAVSGCKLVN